MSFLTSKFSKIKKKLEKSKQDQIIKLELGEHLFTFNDGEWITENEGGDNLKMLREENNMLKLKMEILLDMLTEAIYGNSQDEMNIQENTYITKS